MTRVKSTLHWLDQQTVSLLWVSVLATAYLTLAPTLLGALVDRLGLSPKSAGLVTSAQMAGSMLGSLAVTSARRRWTVSSLLRTSVVGMAMCDLACSFLTDAPALIGCRLVAGLFAGFGFATVSARIADLSRPALVYGAMVIAQMMFGIVGYLSLPVLLERIGVRGVFICLSVLAAMCVPAISRRSSHKSVSTLADDRGGSGTGIRARLLFASLTCVYVANSAIWTYLDRIGVSAGLSERAISFALAFSMLAGLAGAVIASMTSLSVRVATAIIVGVSIMAVSTALLLIASVTSIYVIAVAAFNGTLMYVLPFYLAALAGAPGGDRHVTTASVIIFGALAVGPMVGSQLLLGSGYSLLIAASTVAFLAAIVLVAVGERWSRNDRVDENIGASA